MAPRKKKTAPPKARQPIRKAPKRKKSPLTTELLSLVAIAVGIFLLISIFSKDTTGFIGGITETFFKGLFGFGAYLLPFIVIGVSLYFLFAEQKSISNVRVIAGIALFVCVASITHIITMNRDVSYKSIFDYLAANYSGGGIQNGGLVGAIFGNFLYGLMGKVGAYIILYTVSIVTLVLLTGKSFFQALRQGTLWIHSFVAPSPDDGYDDEYEEEYIEIEADEPEIPTVVPRRPAVMAKTRPRAKGKEGKIFVIEERPDKGEKHKILLFSEELKARKKPNPILMPRNANMGEKASPQTIHDFPGIRVKGLIEEPAGEEGCMVLPEMVREPETVWRNLPDTEPQWQEEEETWPDTPEAELQWQQELMPDTESLGISDVAEPQWPEMPDTEWEMDPEAGTIWQEGPDEEAQPSGYHSPGQPAADIQTPSDIVPPKPVMGKPDKPSAGDPGIKPPVIDFMPMQYEYIFPSIDMLSKNPTTNTMGSRSQILENSRKLEDTLKSFGVEAKVVEVSKGPTVTRYELSPGAGVKVSKISSLADDLALNLAAVGIRIEAPIPGKAAVGIEIPNKEVQPVYLREVIDDDVFTKFPSKLAFALGKDIAGNTMVWDIGKMPHLLIAGATGAGKSVCINTLITSIIYKATPDEVKLLMVDPKVVELSVYNGIPHLLIPVVTDPKKAAGALNWAVAEMISRYNMFAETSVRDLKGYNALRVENAEDPLPQIVIIIDELADLMMAAPGEVEDAICRLAQMARAAGLHLIIATQRPSVDVITGLIKANVPSRLAFAVSSGTDSRTVLDMVGAEKLLGKGDMLFCPVGMGKPIRIQGAFISDKEVEGIVTFLKTQQPHGYDQEMIEKITSSNKVGTLEGEADEFFEEAVTFVIQREKASASMLQRQFRIGYNRASRLIEDLENKGIIGPEDGSKPRKVLMTMYQWNELRSE